MLHKHLINKIHNMDCLDLMAKLPDNSVDLVLIGPPYEISKSDVGKTQMSELSKFKKNSSLYDIADGFDVNKVLNECLRVLKKCNMFIFCSNKQLSKIMSWGEQKGFFTTCLVWHKYNSTPFANGVWRGDIEFCIHIREKGAYFEGNANLKQKVTRLPTNPSQHGHPTEKPLKLIEKYILIGSQEDDLVLDCFMGSGTTAVACKALNRNFIGCDISKEYVEIANKRISNVQASLIFEVGA